MRLVCPNCSAQYEVDASMIPEEGRDVQCSNCGHTWFELPSPQVPAFEAAIASEPMPELDEDEEDPARTRPTNLSRELFEDDDDRDDSWRTPREKENEAERDAKISEAVHAIASPEPTKVADDGDGDGEDEDTVPAAAAVTGKLRRPADAADLDILREEAERELSQRRAPPSEALETQADLGLDEVRGRATPSRALRARMAHLGEEEPPTEKPNAARNQVSRDEDEDEGYTAPRRDLLPDIDEINSTLKPKTKPQEKRPRSEASQRSGFRAGFLLMLLATIGAVFVYAQAPAIARALPNAEPTLIRYVDAANGVRDWIDGLLAN